MLFDRDEVPDLAAMSADEAWEACEAFEDYACQLGDDVSDDRFDDLIRKARELYDTYYTLFE